MKAEIYNLGCLVMCMVVLTEFIVNAVLEMRHERWHRVGSFMGKYPRRKKKDEKSEKVLVTDCEGNVGEALFYYDTYRFSIGNVRAWKNYPKPYKRKKGIVRIIKDYRDRKLLEKIKGKR